MALLFALQFRAGSVTPGSYGVVVSPYKHPQLKYSVGRKVDRSSEPVLPLQVWKPRHVTTVTFEVALPAPVRSFSMLQVSAAHAAVPVPSSPAARVATVHTAALSFVCPPRDRDAAYPLL